jgi:hypothetical protein
MTRVLLVLLLATVAPAQRPEPHYVAPTERSPERGHSLTSDEMRAGWISLFDGWTQYGWADAVVRDGTLAAGVTTSSFGEVAIRAEGASTDVRGDRLDHARGGPIRLKPGVALRSLSVRPTLVPLLGQPGQPDAKVIAHATLPRDRQATWTPVERDHHPVGYRAVGGPGCLELPGLYGDFVLQVDVTCRKPLCNAGVFFRSRPGDFLNGYEAQVFNGCTDGDPSKPALYATGAIDDRQNARRLISRDGEPFTLTIAAKGSHIATWVNGVQVTDWVDRRPANDNPREGLRLEPGAIQLQAHDKGTDVEFSNVRIAPLP